MKFVFVSHAAADADLAQAVVDRLKTALEPEGVDVRFDEDRSPARLFPEWVDENIAAAERVLVLWSDNAANDVFVRSEAEKARALSKYVACLIDPELDPERDLPPPFNVPLTSLVVMPDMAADASTLALDDAEFGKLTVELGKPPALPDAKAASIGAAANPEEAAERESRLAGTNDPWSLPGRIESEAAAGQRLRTLFVGALGRLLVHEDAEIRAAAAKYLEADMAAQDAGLNELASAASRINSRVLWNDVGAVHLPRRASDAVAFWRRAGFTEPEIRSRLGLPSAPLRAAAAERAARILAAGGGDPAPAPEGKEQPEEAATAPPEEAAVTQETEALADEPGDLEEDDEDDVEDADEDDEQDADDGEEDDDVADKDDDRRKRRSGGGAGWFLGGAMVALLLLVAGAGSALYFVEIDDQPLYSRFEAALRPQGTVAIAAVEQPEEAAVQTETAAPSCLVPERFNRASFENQRETLAACGLTLAELPAVPPPLRTPAWCVNADVYAALAGASGDISDELAACGVTLPAPPPDVRVETQTVACPNPDEFNRLDLTGQRALLRYCGLNLAEAPVVASRESDAVAAPTAAPATAAVPPPGDGAQACSPTVGPPCRVTLGSPTALSRIAETFYGRPQAWCWIYEKNREAFQSESRPALVRDDPNCVYAGDSYMLEALPADWSYRRDCAHAELLSTMCPRSMAASD